MATATSQTVKPARSSWLLRWLEFAGGAALLVSYFLRWGYYALPSGWPGGGGIDSQYIPVLDLFSNSALLQNGVEFIIAVLFMLLPPAFATLAGLLAPRARQAPRGWATSLSFMAALLFGVLGLLWTVGYMVLSNIGDSTATHINDIGSYMSVAGCLLIIVASFGLLTSGLFTRRFE